MHENSLKSYLQEKEEGRLNKRSCEILEVLKLLPGQSARQIMLSLGYDDMNKVRPRLTELKQLNLIIETGKIRDIETGKRVSVFSIKQENDNNNRSR